MIKETTKKLHLLPYHPKRGRLKDTSDAPTITIFGKVGRIQFGRDAVEQMSMEGKFVKFYFDPIKRIVAWKITDKVDQREMKLWKVCRLHVNGVWQLTLKKMFMEFQGSDKLLDKYKNLPIQKYRNVEMMALPNETYYFVQLKETKEAEETEENALKV